MDDEEGCRKVLLDLYELPLWEMSEVEALDEICRLTPEPREAETEGIVGRCLFKLGINNTSGWPLRSRIQVTQASPAPLALLLTLRPALRQVLCHTLDINSGWHCPVCAHQRGGNGGVWVELWPRCNPHSRARTRAPPTPGFPLPLLLLRLPPPHHLTPPKLCARRERR